MNALNSQVQTKHELPALTGVRFFASVGVVFFHYAPPAFLPYIFARTIISQGYMTVGLFFVLSGFVLAYRYPDLAPSPGKCRRFWIARFTRIYPTYVFALLPVAVTGLYLIRHGTLRTPLKQWLVEGLLSAACLQAWIPQTALSWNFPGWSISCEAFFYAVFPFAIYKLRRLPRKRLLLSAATFWLFSLLGPCLLLTARHLGVHTGWTVWLFNAPVEVEDLFFNYCPIFHLPAFLIGVVTGLLFLDRGPQPPAISLAALSIVSAIVLYTCFTSLPEILVRTGLLAPVFAVFIYALTTNYFVTALVGCYPLRILGRASYAIYILQAPLVGLTRPLLRLFRITASSGQTLYFAQYLAVLIAVSLVVTCAAERLRPWLARQLAS